MGTVTLAGTATAALLVASAIAAVIEVVLFNEAVHVVDPPLLRTVGEHTKPVNWTGASRLRETVLMAPLYAAAITAAWSTATPTLVAVKLRDVCPAARVTLAGTVRLALLLESAISAPPASAAEVRETVHEVLPGVFIAVVAQPIPLKVGSRDREIEPAPTAVGIELPAALVAITAVIWMGIVVAEGLGAI